MKGIRGLALIILLILVGCSNNGVIPIIPDSPVYVVSGHPCPGTGGTRTILAIGTIRIDTENLSATFLPNRELAKHWDVTPMLQPPHCSDCVKIEVLEFKPAQKYIKLKVSLKNPTNLTGYDVRGIAIVPSPDVRLLNADGWTGLWDDGGDVTRNPFKAFAIDWPNHEIQPGTAHSRKYEFTYSTLSQLAGGTQVVIDASWPGHCQEAYLFDAVQQDGHIDGETSSADFSVSITPQDWQGNISTVFIDLTEIGGGTESMLQNGNSWEFAYEASVGVPDTPRANIWVEVVDELNPVRAYWLFEIGIVSEDPSLPVPDGINAGPGEVYVDLTWDQVDDPKVVGVNIYRRIKGSGYDFGMPLNPAPIPNEKYRDSAVSRNVMYYYVLRAVGIDGALGPISTEVGAKPFEWDEQFRLSDDDYNRSKRPDVSIGPDGRSRVVWWDERPGPVQSQRQYFDIIEVNHTPDINLFPEYPGHSTFNDPHIVVSDENINYLYALAAFGTGGGGVVIHPFDDSLDMTDFWSFDSGEGYGLHTKGACFDLDDNFTVVYEELIYNPPTVNVFFRSVSPEGLVSDKIMISPPDYTSNNHIAGLACDSLGEFHCAFTVNAAAPLYGTRDLFYSRTISGEWQPAEQATNLELKNQHKTMYQRIDVDSLGRAYLTFATADVNYPYISLIRRDPGGWSEPVDVFPEFGASTGLALTIDDDDVINVFYSPYTPYDDECAFRRGYDGSWSDVFIISEGKISNMYPGSFSFEISADSSVSGACAVAWESGESHIYARRMME